MKPIRVFLADDHTVVREGIRMVLETDPDIEVVGEAQNGRQAIEAVRTLKPNVLILDLAMPSLNGLDAARQVLREAPGTRVLILSSYSDEGLIEELVQARVSGYVVKETASDDLLRAVRIVAEGKEFFSPRIARRLALNHRDAFLAGGRPSVKRKLNTLSLRESEVLQLIAEGYANKQIAQQLTISVKTVEKHRQQIMNKLNIRDVAGLTRYAISRRMVESPFALRAAV